MICTIPKKGEEKLLPVRLVGIIARFEGHEDGIDLGKLFRIADFQDPAFLRLIVHVQYSQALDRRRIGLPFSPRLVGVVCVVCVDYFSLVEIKGVENERLPFGVEHTPEGPSVLSSPIPVIYVNDMQTPRTHEVGNVASRHEQLFLSIEALRLRLQSARKLIDA